MIKKIIFFLFLSVISLAQQVELKSIERKIDANGESYTITTSQTYNKKNNKLEVLHIDKSPEQATYKEIIQFDIKGEKELSNEKFFYDPSLKKWSKDVKKVTSYKNNKKIEEIYIAEENKWTGDTKYESEESKNSKTLTVYSYENKKWLPSSKTYTLLNENKEDNIIELYTWNKNKQKWDLETKLVNTFNKEGKLEERTEYKNKGRLVTEYKLKFYTNTDEKQDYSNLSFENGKWIKQDRTLIEFDKLNNKKVVTIQQINNETKQLENVSRSVQTYKNDTIVQEIEYFWNKDKKEWYKHSELNFFYDENKNLIRKQAFSDEKGIQFTYKFDKNGNNIEILLEHLNSQTKSWEVHEKIEYLYDLSITKDKVLDRAYINDENETSVNLILEKNFYIYDGKKWILKENDKYLYDKK
ncbi:hypothetical protein [Fusobacterium pseudoperiodonticum]|jgi:hypothetical protein|uniref:Type IV secretion protein Rhs n=1 Tax=Fusobacterium pseudoperiodonticum TaxID=2663009 RepID=A0A2D3PT93_9FUSO|nr:hypothetical protein [Fusobacterium pseudoperiodonticum]ATV70316.1 hypothetical protein CTM98_06470 [Fusobacterium pseudoperiodonticum]